MASFSYRAICPAAPGDLTPGAGRTEQGTGPALRQKQPGCVASPGPVPLLGVSQRRPQSLAAVLKARSDFPVRFPVECATSLPPTGSPSGPLIWKILRQVHRPVWPMPLVSTFCSPKKNSRKAKPAQTKNGLEPRSVGSRVQTLERRLPAWIAKEK